MPPHFEGSPPGTEDYRGRFGQNGGPSRAPLPQKWGTLGPQFLIKKQQFAKLINFYNRSKFMPVFRDLFSSKKDPPGGARPRGGAGGRKRQWPKFEGFGQVPIISVPYGRSVFTPCGSTRPCPSEPGSLPYGPFPVSDSSITSLPCCSIMRRIRCMLTVVPAPGDVRKVLSW